MIKTTTPEGLTDELDRRVSSQGRVVVSMDGVDGCGKTTLASSLGNTLGWKVIHLDDYLEENKDAFLDALRTDELRAAVELAVEEPCPVIVEGVCVAAVLALVGFRADVTVYVKRMSGGHYWRDEDRIYAGANSAKEKINLVQSENREAEAFWGFSKDEDEPIPDNEPRISGLERDLIEYHWEYFPDRSADFVHEHTFDAKT